MSKSRKNENKYKLSHREFIILGLIAENPIGSHAYSLDQKIEERGMRNWTNIGTSSIYSNINGLEEDGLVSSYTEEVDNRIRKVYKITEDGARNLKNKILEVLSNFVGRNDEDFYVAFSNMMYLSEEEVILALKNSINKITRHLKELEDMLEENKNTPLCVRGLFIHPIKILETDLGFLKEVIDELNKNGFGKFE
ncbi:MAG: hypothetical protein GF383_00210 [Candidatus Lokiarchaeota archaeon]|nr:hypothetical protein [Candidatus Lokiarchaeota archaeon]MBD3337517.1 hypothetical protein [Candidatus Lokiarchaeota archaeon]